MEFDTKRMKMGVSDNDSLLDRVTECDMRGEDDDLEFRIQEKHEEDEDILSRKVPSSSAGEKTESMELSPGEISVDNEDNSERITFTPNQIHPLANHVVLGLVFNYLHVDELKYCRLVCKLWDDLATPSMLSKGVISVDTEDVTKLVTLQSWMNSSYWYGPQTLEPNKTRFFQHIVCDNITHATYPNIWGILGSHVRSFTVSSWWNDKRDLTLDDYEDLLIRRCPNLEELTAPSTEKFTQAEKFLEFAKPADNEFTLNLHTLKIIGDIKPDDRFWRVIALSPKLRYLKLDCEIDEEFWNPYPPKQDFDRNMKNLDVLEVRSYGNESVTNCGGSYYLMRSWTLKTLNYENYVLTDDFMKNCSEHIKDTCETLYITFFNRKYLPWPADKDKEWMIPPTMVKLKDFRLEIDDHCEGPILCRSAFLAIYLPSLVSLRLGTFEDTVNWNEADWEDGLYGRIFDDCATPQDKLIKRESVKLIQLPPKFQDLSCVSHFTRVFPNIEEVELHSPSPEAFAAIVTQWTKIRRLKLTLMEDETTNWNSVLTGLEMYEDESATAEEEKTKFFYTGASLSELKGLTSLEISLIPGQSLSEILMPLNDFLIYYVLLSLPALQYIRVRGHQFSEGAVQELREKSLLFCYIDLYD